MANSCHQEYENLSNPSTLLRDEPFLNRPVSLQDVADTLWTTFGAVHGSSRTDLSQLGMRSVGYRRTSPSGGSMQPSEPFLVALNVSGLSPGVYHYRSIRHELSYVGDAPSDDTVCRLLCGQTVAKELAYGVFVTSRFDKLWWKYPHSRAYRVALMDVGCLAQTFQLVSTALGIQSWATGYFIDTDVVMPPEIHR
ncbi:SagB/ThcOx family dehydrogenase [Pandoraea oxalativorans]|uniref:SagB/ThcOx family dehydrogenase n=1 Tax=Pandoraea oxalativorans TaxID=573737 RepID=UPI000A06740E|nr:SagB/ThcOx family dehydrogenase [Pandoraea oxalativorans]